MRVALLAAVMFLSACASDRLSLAPPPGVDFSGQWKLNEADSDDPMHLLQAANHQSAAAGNAGGSGARGGRGAGAGLGPTGPMTPSMGALGEGLRWPGKRLEVKQVAGVVAFTSEGKNRVCEPSDAQKKPQHRSVSSDPDGPVAAGRDVLPPRCGWSENTLIVRSDDPYDDRPPFEERYSLSQDGQRLIEVVGFKGGRSNGFVMSRVWDRVAPGCNYADDPKKCDQGKSVP
jgi:hypothetical protein